ncbi:MAG: hypothetical protein FD123_3621 [Bacteroidetes bacterium]|nr:MAG: hypothetical protein FD123_3621 [Bacteroidota bacterium]
MQIKPLVFLVAIATGLAFFSSCGSNDAKPMNALDSLKAHVAQYDTATKEDYDYIVKTVKLGAPFELNIADDRQYRFVVSGLLRSGDTPEKSPQLFRNLKSLREKIKRSGPPRIAFGFASPEAMQTEDYKAFGDDPAAAGASADGTDPLPATNINTIEYLYELSPNNYKVSGLSSLTQAANSTTMYFTMQTYQNSQPFFVSNTYKAFGAQTLNFQSDTSATVPSGQQNEDVIAFAVIAPENSWPVTVASAALLNATDQCVTAPNYGVHQAPPTTCPPAGSTCINKENISQPIVSCYGRNDTQTGNCGVCNYGWGGSGYPPNITLAISGSIKFPYQITTNPTTGAPLGLFQMYLQKSGGGGCYLNYKDTASWMQLPAANFTVSSGDNTTLNYCFTSADFKNNACLTTPVTQNILNLNVSVQLTGSGVPGALGQAQVSSSYCAGIGSAWCAAIPYICVVQGCLRAGTKVLMVDGKEVEIEKLKGDGSEYVIADAEKNRNKVVTITDGFETIPMFRIITENGKSVCMTAKHAVPTVNGGVKLADELAAGDELYTTGGNSKIKIIAREKWDGAIYNMYAGSESQAANNQTTFYADGVLVGDMGMQIFYTNLSNMVPDMTVIAKKLPKEWQEDMKNYYRSKK